MLFVPFLLGLVVFETRRSLLLGYFCIVSMAMPRCLFFGLVCMFLSFLLPFLFGPWGLSCIHPVYFFWSISLLFTDKKKTILKFSFPNK